MKKINRLPKGFPVLYRMRRDKSMTMKETLESLRERDGIVASVSKYDPEIVLIKGFVVGDTKEKGISVVALDNTNVCLTKSMNTADANRLREMLRKGHYSEGSRGNSPLGTPICNYR